MCGEAGGAFDPTELVCGGCSPWSGDIDCPKHGKDFIEFKCRFCCSVAVRTVSWGGVWMQWVTLPVCVLYLLLIGRSAEARTMMLSYFRWRTLTKFKWL